MQRQALAFASQDQTHDVMIFDFMCQRPEPDAQCASTGDVSQMLNALPPSRCGASDLYLFLSDDYSNYASSTGGHMGLVTAIAWAPDGRSLVSAAKDRAIRVWDVSKPSSVELHSTRGPAEVWAVDWSPDGSTIVSSQGGSFFGKFELQKSDSNCHWDDTSSGSPDERGTPPKHWRRCGRISTWDGKVLNTLDELAAAGIPKIGDRLRIIKLANA